MTKKYDYLIIGGGVAGVTAAETVREKEPRSSIAIVEDESHPLYSRVLLPSYLKKRIPREKVFLRRTEDFSDKKIDLLLEEKAVSLDTVHREISLSGGLNLNYGKLLIATGGKPKPWLPGSPEKLTYRLQNLDDADKVFQNLEKIKNPLVVGGSFIALEFLEIFVVNKITPSLLIKGKYFWDRILDERGGELMHRNFGRFGIKTDTEDTVEAAAEKDGKVEIITNRGRKMEGDALAVGIGLERSLEFLADSGVIKGEQGIRTNEFLETNLPGIYAAGDAAEFYDVISDKHRLVGNWTHAFLQGKAAGLNLTGRKEEFRAVSSYSLTNLGFQLTALGEYRDSDENIVRHDAIQNAHERIFLKNGIITGAILINRFQDKNPLIKLIEQKIPIGAYQKEMTDFSFDLGQIPMIR